MVELEKVKEMTGGGAQSHGLPPLPPDALDSPCSWRHQPLRSYVPFLTVSVCVSCAVCSRSVSVSYTVYSQLRGY